MGIFLFHLQSNTFQMILAVPNKQSFCSISTSSYFNSSYLFFFFHPPCFTLGRQVDTMGWSTDTYHFLLYNCNILSVVLHLLLCFYGTVLQNFTLFWFKYPHILLIYVHTIYQLFQITIFHKICNELLWQNCYACFFWTHSAGTWDILIPYALQFPLIWHLICKL